MVYGTILGQTSSGKRVCRLVVGTSTSGWTTSDCDYLCDGTADDVEINAAIQALPSTGGEIVILDGTYNITATIAMNKDNTKLSGNGAATILKRMWKGSTLSEAVININATNGGCCVENLQIDGNKTTYPSNNNRGILLRGSNNNTVTGNTCNNNYHGIYVYPGSSNNTITGNTCNNNSNRGIHLNSTNVASSDNNTVTGNTCNNNSDGIYMSGSDNNIITGNTCSNNNIAGIDMNISDNNTITGNICNNNNRGIHLEGSDANTITGNTCNNNNYYGIFVYDGSSNNTITGNTFIRGTGQPSDYTSDQNTICLYGTDNNYNLIANNNIMGKNYVSDGGTSNTFVNNKYN